MVRGICVTGSTVRNFRSSWLTTPTIIVPKSPSDRSPNVICNLRIREHQATRKRSNKFIDLVYFPHAEKNKRPSTVHGDRKLYSAYIEQRIGSVRLLAFRTRDAQRLLDQIATENDLTHQTFKNIKSFLGAVFKLAKRLGSVDQNPIRDTEAPKGQESAETHAYSEAEITEMLRILDGVGKVAVCVAAYTGLSLGELQGLQFPDITEDSIKVQRTIWRGIEGMPKTAAFEVVSFDSRVV